MKLFSIAEANDLIPQVRQLLEDLRRIRSDIAELEQKKAIEELSWLRADGSVSPKAQQAMSQLQKVLESKGRAFEEKLGALNILGAQLKDLEEGLIDFCTERDDRLVLLCWKEGESQIGYWHDMEAGFAGRQPLT